MNKVSMNVVLVVGLIAVLLISFLVTNIKKESKVSDIKEMNVISATKYMSLLKDNDNSIIYVGRPTCSYCVVTKPILDTIISTYKININYLNLDSFTDSDNNLFYNSNDYIKNGDWGTPLVMIVNSNKIVDKSVGSSNKEAYIALFQKYNFIK